jgi:hypothetical protein
LAIIICRTSGEVRSMVGLGGKELMVMSAPTVVEVQLWDVSGGDAGHGSKERSKGQE